MVMICGQSYYKNIYIFPIFSFNPQNFYHLNEFPPSFLQGIKEESDTTLYIIKV